MSEFTEHSTGHPDTDAVHCGEKRWLGSITTPIAYTSTFVFKDMDEVVAFGKKKIDHYEYGRYGNPTREAAERKLAALEGADRCMLFDSGMSAVSATILSLCDQGQHLVITDDAYKQTLNFVSKVLPRFGIDATIVSMGDYKSMADAVRKETVMVISESPTNPYLNIADVDEVVRIARKNKLLSVIDSTFATPLNQRPLDQGVDIVIHSTTKYLGGHNDILGGAVCGRKEVTEPIYEWRRVTGGVVDPMSCYLLIRGLKTFGLRVERLNQTAQQVAEFLEAHTKVRKVYYPGLPSHPHHEIARRQMKGFGAVVTFEIDGDMDDTMAFFNDLKLCLLGPSLGGPETLITHPALMSYYRESREERYRLGIIDELVRLSVGLEDPQDIIADLERGLAKVRQE
ncbi:MAG: aminotransferase class I/II-fold pyridoxal phosphate-dependent enzyme [Planctomycetota bacterium]|nr:MAG: aminotransferase class I/II-fold pyridoxal phosphate-dependent enzyme [Planctomycetota bacterium]